MKRRRYLVLNSRVYPEDIARIPALDQAVLYGYGFFETLRTYDGYPFRLEAHLSRLRRSAHAFALSAPLSNETIRRSIGRLLRANGESDTAVRITMTAGPEKGRPNIILSTRGLPDLHPEAHRNGVRVELSPSRRPTEGLLFGHKTLNYLENILWRKWAQEHQAFEIIFATPSDKILEGTASNIFLVKRGRITTPHLTDRILPGIARTLILEICRKNALPVEERSIRLSELIAADEVFLTNSLIEVLPVSRIGTHRIGRGRCGPLTRLLIDAYHTIAEQECR